MPIDFFSKTCFHFFLEDITASTLLCASPDLFFFGSTSPRMLKLLLALVAIRTISSQLIEYDLFADNACNNLVSRVFAWPGVCLQTDGQDSATFFEFDFLNSLFFFGFERADRVLVRLRVPVQIDVNGPDLLVSFYDLPACNVTASASSLVLPEVRLQRLGMHTTLVFFCCARHLLSDDIFSHNQCLLSVCAFYFY